MVRRGYEALNRGDLQTTLAMFDPRVEVHVSREGRENLGVELSDVYRGLDGFMELMGELQRAWGRLAWEPEQLIDAGERVVALVRVRGTARDSGAALDQPIAQVCTIRDGQLVRHETYWDREAALRDLGLPPSG